jgi:RuvB-like protein 1 (pontin 52)
MKPVASTSASSTKRVAVHSHIKGLGLDDEGVAREDAGGFIGQTSAREVGPFPYKHVQRGAQSLC